MGQFWIDSILGISHLIVFKATFAEIFLNNSIHLSEFCLDRVFLKFSTLCLLFEFGKKLTWSDWERSADSKINVLNFFTVFLTIKILIFLAWKCVKIPQITKSRGNFFSFLKKTQKSDTRKMNLNWKSFFENSSGIVYLHCRPRFC